LGDPEHDPETHSRVTAFGLGTRDAGWVEGRNLPIESRYAGTDRDTIKKHVPELIWLDPDVILSNSGAVMGLLQQSTSTIPSVFLVVNDPVRQGFISDLAHPGGNVTGLSCSEPEIGSKWVNLVADLKPDLPLAVLMYNPDTAAYYDAY